MVEILRPAQHHRALLESETVQVARPGAPFAPFLAQFLAQGQANELTNAEIAERYENAAALMGEPIRVCIATA